MSNNAGKGGRSFFLRGQISMEFILVIIFILSLFVFGIAMFNSRSEMNYSYSTKWASQDVAFRISRDISNVYLLNDGASIRDSFVWADYDKNISFSGHVVFANYGAASYGAPFVAESVDVTADNFSGTIIFRKVGGKVVITK